jgi:hypothetical protein
VAVELYEDHSVKADTDPRYIKPVAWFYTKDEALGYIAGHSLGKPEEGEGK